MKITNEVTERFGEKFHVMFSEFRRMVILVARFSFAGYYFALSLKLPNIRTVLFVRHSINSWDEGCVTFFLVRQFSLAESHDTRDND